MSEIWTEFFFPLSSPPILLKHRFITRSSLLILLGLFVDLMSFNGPQNGKKKTRQRRKLENNFEHFLPRPRLKANALSCRERFTIFFFFCFYILFEFLFRLHFQPYYSIF